jgi:hypothetical protein
MRQRGVRCGRFANSAMAFSAKQLFAARDAGRRFGECRNAATGNRRSVSASAYRYGNRTGVVAGSAGILKAAFSIVFESVLEKLE